MTEGTKNIWIILATLVCDVAIVAIHDKSANGEYTIGPAIKEKLGDIFKRKPKATA